MGETIMGDFRWFLILFIQRALAAMICWRDSRFQNGRLESPFFTFQDQKNACFKIVLGQPPGFKFNRRLINRKGSIESSSKIIVAFQPPLCLFSFATPTRWQRFPAILMLRSLPTPPLRLCLFMFFSTQTTRILETCGHLTS